MNYYTVSVKEALQAGRMNLKYIPYAIFTLSGMITGGYVFYLFFYDRKNDFGELHDIVPALDLALFVPVAGFLLSIVWRSLHSAAWKIYVLENVQDVHRAFKLAESEGMIYGESHLLRKLEYRSPDQRERLAMLEVRLSQPRQFEAAGGVPVYEEQAFRYAFRMAIGQGITIVGFFAAVYYFAHRKNADFPPVVFLIPLGILAFLAYRWVPRFNGPPPIRFDAVQLTLDNKTPTLWTDVTNLYIEMRKHGKSSIPWLIVQTVGGYAREIALNEIDGSPADIEDTLYQHWSIARQKAQQQA